MCRYNMFLLKLLKTFPFFHNLAGTILSIISPIIEHNFAKYQAIKRALYLTALEKIDGDYLEFGVFTGGSLIFATKAEKRLSWVNKTDTKFYGFDSFQGFGEAKPIEHHPFYKDDIFAVDFGKVRRNIERNTRGSTVHLVKGFFSETLDDRSPASYGIGRAKVIFIDCDLKSPALAALSFCQSLIQEGTVLILDDYFSYKGNPDLGISGAFREFKEKFPKFVWRRLFHYGYLGQVFICASITPSIGRKGF